MMMCRWIAGLFRFVLFPLYVLFFLLLLLGVAVEAAGFGIRRGEGFFAIVMLAAFINAFAYLFARVGSIRCAMSQCPRRYGAVKMISIHADLFAGCCIFAAWLHHWRPGLTGGAVLAASAGVWLIGRLLMCRYFRRYPVGSDVMEEKLP